MKPNFTEAPWHSEPLQDDDGRSTAICKAGRGIIAVIPAPAEGDNPFPDGEDAANIRLIETAPRLHAALDSLVDLANRFINSTPTGTLSHQLCEAILEHQPILAKARGEA